MASPSPQPHATDRRTFLRYTAGAASVLPLAALAGCSGGDRDPSTIRVAYQQFGSGTLMEDWINRTAESYTQEHPDRTALPHRESYVDRRAVYHLRQLRHRLATH